MNSSSPVLRHWKQKLFSLVIAVALSLYVGNMRISDRVIAVPLQIRNSPGFLIPVVPFPETVTLRVKGKPRELMVFNPQEITASVDLSKARPGYNTFFLELNHNRSSKDFTIAPTVKSFRVFMDRLLIKRLKLKAVLINKPATGFVLESYKLAPEVVTVRGPVSVLREIQELRCRPVNISAINQSTERIVKPDFNGHNLALQTPVSIILTLNVVPLTTTRDFKDIPIAFVGKPEGIVLAEQPPKVVTIKATGSRSAIMELQNDRFKPVLNLSSLTNAGRHTLKIEVPLPPGVSGITIIPPTVSLTVE